MRIYDCLQGSEEWERLRHRPTASEFSSFCTPARCDYAKGATAYAAKIVAKRLGVYVEPPPSFWMEWGTEMEPHALDDYAAFIGQEVVQVGFIADDDDLYGCSPDGLVGDDGMVQIKCPKPETLIMWHASAGNLPAEYKLQIQGEMWVAGRQWNDLWAWHPDIKPFHLRVEADWKYHERIADCMELLLEEIARLESLLTTGD